MESVQLNNVTDTIESEAEPSNIEEESENSVTDIMNLDIKSRLSLATSDTYEEPRTNGMPRQGHFNEHDEAKTLSLETDDSNIQYVSYTSELQMPDIMHLIQKDLSEPYSIYTYRYFIHNWPKLCFLAMDGDKCIGAIVCKLDIHRKVIKRGYIAMLAVDVKYRKRKVGSNLVRRAIQAMMEDNADEVVLETEITNSPALRLYENLGFVRDKRLFRYYLNGVDALRLKLWLR
ncbi:N-alpha-acetyltransferase 30 [Lasioglossum baleicum]|uniref:N-alpha-acetyltransferase 30 n=1 Tax=Lasioglossum baleicum TaxID=434251 RepID=UPI003FCEDE8F